MQLTFDQYGSLIALAAAMTAFGFFSYHCGLKDRAGKIKEAVDKAEILRTHNNDLHVQLDIIEHCAETKSRAIELLNDELEAANLIKRRQVESLLESEDITTAYIELAAQQKSEIEALKLQLTSEDQKKTIRQAASQLLLTSQIMGAINNKESASTQRTLATRLMTIVGDASPASQSSVSEAA